MVYDKFIVSLYKENVPLPQIFVEVEKRNNTLSLSVCGGNGYLFIYSGEYAVLRCDKKARANMPNLNFNAPFFFCFIEDKGGVNFGKRGNIKNEEEVKKKFFSEHQKLLKRGEMAFDLNNVVDQMMQKMFQKQVTSFFEHTKRQLNNLFLCSKRAAELESIIPYSRFVETLSEGTKGYAGIVYKDGLPYAVGIGFCYNDIDKLTSEAPYEYFYNKNNETEGYFLSFRRATDGDRVEITH